MLKSIKEWMRAFGYLFGGLGLLLTLIAMIGGIILVILSPFILAGLVSVGMVGFAVIVEVLKYIA